MARRKKDEGETVSEHDNSGTTGESVTETTQAQDETQSEGGEGSATAQSAASGDEGEGKTGSIVKKKYAGRYKDHRDGLSKFIADQCVVEGDFKYDRFFALCRANGIKEDHIDPFKAILDPEAKINGLAGRTRMTLRNRLAAIVRKNEGKIMDIDGAVHDTDTAPITVRTPTMTEAKEVQVGNTATEGHNEPDATEVEQPAA